MSSGSKAKEPYHYFFVLANSKLQIEMFIIIAVLSSVLLSGVESYSDAGLTPIVTVESGALVGGLMTSRDGRTIYSYRGIPYARAERFKVPEPPTSWNGIRDASREGGRCPQYEYITNSFLDFPEECCLMLNVFTPKLPKGSANPKLDVIVYFHGGAFIFGSGSTHYYHPKYFMDHDVILVTINYRLGILGFLSTGDEIASGNWGLKDQVAALQWVQRNIAKFGGNPNSVTLLGNSAGGASVHYHILSPLSTGLFHRAFSMSGTALCPWALAKEVREKSQNIAKNLGCPSDASESMVTCLQAKPVFDIVLATKSLFIWMNEPFTPIGPVVEGNLPGSFLPDEPALLMKEGKFNDVPWITGVTTEDGLWSFAWIYGSSEHWRDLRERFDEVAQYPLSYELTASDPSDISRRVREFYVGKTAITEDNLSPVIDIFSDRLFVQPAVKSALLQAERSTSPVYFYRFGFQGEQSITEAASLTERDLGVSHVDDLPYYFPFPLRAPVGITRKERDISNMLLEILTSFAKNGKPDLGKHNIEWIPVSKGDLKYLNITDTISMASDLDLGRSSFWKTLPLKEHEHSAKASKRKDEL